MPTLLYLPNEIIYKIADQLPSRDVNSLCQTTRPLYQYLIRHLYRRNIVESHSTALFWAATHGYTSLAQALLEENADIHTTGGSLTESESDFQARYARLSAHVQSLVGRGDDDLDKLSTPLIIASAVGHVEIVDLFLHHGADPNTVNGAGRSAMDIAARNGHMETMRVLLRYGARGCHNSSSSASTSYDTIHVAAGGGHPGALRILIENGVDPNRRTYWGDTALKVATRSGHIDAVKTLLDLGVEFMNRDRDMHTALYEAVKRDNVQIASLLLDAGDEIEGKDRWGRTTLTCAVWFGSMDSATMLLDRGAQIETRDENNCTPLWWACRRGKTAMVKMLLTRGANVELDDPRDANRTTPLGIATRQRHDEIVNLLLDYGADVNRCDREGKSPLWHVVEQGNETMARKLLARGADPHLKTQHSPLVYRAVQKNETAMVRLLLENGADANAVGRLRKFKLVPVLAWALNMGYEEIVHALLDAGADPNTRAYRRAMPVLTGAIIKSPRVYTRLLLEKGADPNLADRYGNTPLFIAMAKGSPEEMRQLLEYGANPHEKRNGRTLRRWAVDRADEAVESVLVEYGA
ncbi:hypothetical protein EYZ11_007693 [Aspergillus tanneri]|uniref:Ankyrin-2 n=1 Tax=Aspergillus tanneri TaxID=1220188 RepID=A0A4S3JHZ4_9EURO|nr:Ankyrin-2 [Aspergillus tanneri]KAA8648465.1 Ankyrin-2 [Aspergillus tanneri]THC92821.1 hypothetical protein EYZ11_007693 [Aspergillus tanneri]